MFNTISSVDPGSRLEGRVLPGDELRYINRHEIHDVLDYKYWAYDRSLTLEFRDAGTIRLRKKEGEDLGLNFETYLMDKPTGCSNRCIFCFIDQLPRGLRKTLYFKDDDARLSFLTGNYITCTNLSERELQRICDLKVSPLNISVHATDPELRAKLIGNPRGKEIMDILRRFAAAGIFEEDRRADTFRRCSRKCDCRIFQSTPPRTIPPARSSRAPVRAYKGRGG